VEFNSIEVMSHDVPIHRMYFSCPIGPRTSNKSNLYKASHDSCIAYALYVTCAIFVLCNLAIVDASRSMQAYTTVYDKHDCALLSRMNVYVHLSLKCSLVVFFQNR